jgi:predicted  nucleic acid-binding Zn-ribbon protein
MDELDRLQKVADSQKREKAKIEGRIESLMEELKDLGYNSIADAKKDMKKINSKIKKMEATFTERLKKFKVRYAEELQKGT